ncbi:hypothetical protein [Heyndrickxia acidicola]|uniref:Uncharacterized protein n=1 Tax=Heyndrickxia acidicola TaxID=209389 RepID=A0ABU6MHQ9_9BACI|nr:hypothetical protein [Heyndrickxia acidicola]MED1203541.1 hypothetical protein [Heyndrickxia acidicola]
MIEQAAKHCMTSAFLLWCHFAVIATLRLSNNSFIKQTMLPLPQEKFLQILAYRTD